jgi:hypothetical protein
MKRPILTVLALVLGFISTTRADAPKVVKAIPDNGQNDVDPAKVRELRIVFDQPMDVGGRSIVGGGETFPKFIGKPHWEDKKTIIVWPMKLEPDHDYWLSINNETFANFKNAKGESAEPYPISFHTKAAGAASQPATSAAAADDNRTAVKILKQSIDEDYSYRDRLKVDWDARFKEFEPKLIAATTPMEFAKQAAALLSAAKDIHLNLRAGEQFVGTHRTGTSPNFNFAVLKKLIPGWTEHEGSVVTGRYDDGIAYVMIPSWSNEQRKGLEAVFAALPDAKKLIIDVRPNGGGDELMAREVAGCFIDEPKVYSKNTIRRNGEFGGPYDRVVEPNKARPAFKGQVVVLMGPKNVSSNESFLLMMRQVKGCKLIGDKSYGSSGCPRPVDLGNGVTALVPSWVDMQPDGTEIEGKGVTPDITVKATLADLQKRDPVLDEALKQLRGK